MIPSGGLKRLVEMNLRLRMLIAILIDDEIDTMAWCRVLSVACTT